MTDTNLKDSKALALKLIEKFIIKDQDMPGKLEIFDMSGRLIKKFQNIKGTITFNISKLKSGLYIARFNNGIEQTTNKIIHIH